MAVYVKPDTNTLYNMSLNIIVFGKQKIPMLIALRRKILLTRVILKLL